MIVVDTSALVALFRGEEEATRIATILADADSAAVSAGTLVEAYIVLATVQAALEPGDQWLDRLLSSQNILIEPVTSVHVQLARTAYQLYGKGSGHGAALNFGDCFAYALAKSLDVPLLYKGNDFSRTDITSALSA